MIKKNRLWHHKRKEYKDDSAVIKAESKNIQSFQVGSNNMFEIERNSVFSTLNDIDGEFSDELWIDDENISEMEDRLSRNKRIETEREMEMSEK